MSMKVRIIKTGAIVEYDNGYAMRLIEQRKAVLVTGDEPVTPEEEVPGYLEICKRVDALEAAMGSAGLVDIHAVRYTAQLLLSSQQAQARENISAASAAEIEELRNALAELRSLVESGGGGGGTQELTAGEIDGMVVSVLENKMVSEVEV